MPRVAIIGAGPAGSTAAIGLTRGGIDVTIFEARPFPRVKVCGEFISPSGAPILESILSEPTLLGLGARRIGLFRLEVGAQFFEWKLPVRGWSLGRGTLDSALLDSARACGAHLRQPAPVRGVRYEPGRVELEFSDGSRELADIVIHADGAGRHDPAGPVPHDPRFIAAKCRFRSAHGPDESVCIRSAPGAYIGTIGIERGLHTCALAVHRDLVRAHRGDFDAMLDQLWPGRRWTDREEWLACPLPRSRFVNPGHPRSLRIGNAAAAVDPIGGEGIANALWSGALLAELVLEHGVESPSALERIRSHMARAYRRRLRTRAPACRGAAWVLTRPWLVRAAGPALKWPALSLRPWYRLTGKPA